MIISPANRLRQTSEYYFSRKLEEVRQMKASGNKVLNLAIGSPDLAPSTETIVELAQYAQRENMHGYQSYRGLPELREAISKWSLQTYNIELNGAAEVLPLIGSKEGITHISMAFLNPGDQVLVPELGYPAYRAVSQMVEAEVLTYPLIESEKGWYPDWDQMAKQDYSKVKILWCNYPHMPTGTPPDPKEMEAFIRFGRERGVLICHDNPYSLVRPAGKPFSMLSLAGAKDVCLELNSLSKSHNMAGWRIGWVAGAAEYLNAIIKIKSNVDSGMFAPMQWAAVKALQNPEEWHEARNRIYDRRQSYALEILEALDCHVNLPQAGMFLWGKLPKGSLSAEDVVDKLLAEKHIFLAPGSIFGAKGNAYLRISLCSPAKVLQEALKRLS